MCGIVGVLNFGPPIVKGIDKSRESSIFFGVTLLELTEPRGKNATGVVAAFDDSMYVGQKMGISAVDFIARFGGKKEDFDSFTKVVREYDSGLRSIIGHCRKNSVGNSFDNANNHPIVAGNIVGVHNGTLTNHTQIFEQLKCKRDGDVDSEAIMRLLEFYTEGGVNPFTLDILYETGSRLNGSFSVLAINTDNPNQAVSMRDGRPAEYCLIKPLNMVLVASEKKFFERAIWEYNKASNLFGHPGFKTLKINDVEFCTLLDESVALFDLTKEITSATKITDLYETKRLPLTTSRLWKTSDKPVNTYNRGYAGQQKSTPINNAHRDYTPTNKPSHKKWDRDLAMFVDSESTEDVVDQDKKKHSTYSETGKRSNELALVLYKNEDYDGAIPVAEVKDYKISGDHKDSSETVEPNPSAAKKTNSEASRCNTIDEIKQQAKDGKNTTQNYRDAHAASILAAKNLEKFKTEEETALFCDIDIELLKKLDIPALSNRILKSVFSRSYRQGWIDKCNEIDSNAGEKQLNKTSNAERTIRVLKTLVHGIDNELYKKLPATTLNCIHKFVSGLPDNTEVNIANLQKAFNTKELEQGVACELIKLLNNE